MAKAHFTKKNGTKILIEGTANEVAALLDQLEANPQESAHTVNIKTHASQSKAKPSPINLISELIDGGFFRKPKELSAIKIALEEQGHYYPVTSLSPTVLRLVRKRSLRRIRDKKRWLYVT